MKINFRKIWIFILDHKLWTGGGVLGVVVLIWLGVWLSHSNTFGVIGKDTNNGSASSISGVICDNAQRRPVAVMMASDPEARPLSGIGQADLVVEMPVTPDGITRFMTLFQCQTPKEIGSVRSAREDFIPLAAGFQSIYAHWGGEAGSLATLKQHVVDNINALTYDGTIFYRKKGVPSPHDGFTTLDLLNGQAQKLGYDMTKNFSGYPHNNDKPARNISNLASKISIAYAGYSGLDAVSWTYDTASNRYLRTRGSGLEIDKNTGQQVATSVLVLMHTDSHILRQGDQYIVVRTTGSGTAEIYQNGIVVSGHWNKDPSLLDSKLRFTDDKGKEIQFVPGSIWIEIVTDS